MKKVAVVLSGCGVYDGAEIHEAVLTLLHLSLNNAKYQCFAPDIPQLDTINHATGEPQQPVRNVLTEAARIARGEIKPLSALRAEEFDAVIVPGGFGAAKNLCDFAVKSSGASVLPEFKAVIQQFSQLHKPAGFMCIAPVMIPFIYADKVSVTIGTESETAAAIELAGGQHINCQVQDIVIDHRAKVVTTPAYMLAQSIAEAHDGIGKLVKAVLELTN